MWTNHAALQRFVASFSKVDSHQVKREEKSYLLPNVFKLFYAFSYLFQTSIDLTCGSKRKVCGKTKLPKSPCNVRRLNGATDPRQQ